MSHRTTSPPLVSVGMPVRNVETLVAEAIESVLAQTVTDLELIISDNASTDGTAEICERYARADPRITLIRQSENIGAEPNFNAVADLARGTYFKWWGGDDLCEPEYLEHCIEVLDRDRAAVLAYQFPIVIDEHGTRLSDPPIAHTVSSHVASERLEALLGNLHRSGGWHASIYSFCLMRTDAVRRAGPIGSYFASDNVFVLTMCLLGAFVDSPHRELVLRVRSESWAQMFGASPTAADIQEFIDPRVTNPVRVYVNRHRRYVQYFSAVLTAPALPIGERMRCTWLVTTHLLSRVRGFVRRRLAR